MMKALISTDQPFRTTQEPIQTGYYVVQVSAHEFEVAPQLFWKECENEVQAYKYWYDPATEEFKLTNPPPEESSGSAPNVIE